VIEVVWLKSKLAMNIFVDFKTRTTTIETKVLIVDLSEDEIKRPMQ